jgi:predicted Zn-dependent protease
LANASWFAFTTGRPADSVSLIERVAAIDPPGGQYIGLGLCRGRLMMGRYAEALPACEKGAGLDDATWHNQALLAAAAAQAGDMQRASVAKSELLKRQPSYSIARETAATLSQHPDYLKMLEEHYFSGLRKAGIPEK